MSERCELTDLPADQCAGTCCRPDLKTPAIERVQCATTFEARFRSRCDHCDGMIEPGQQMGFDGDDNRVCQRHLS